MHHPGKETCGLYRRILGADFDRLPPVLRDFHDAPDRYTVEGYVAVARGPGWLRGWLADAVRLPAAGDAVPIRLHVQIRGDREFWIRRIGSHVVRTVQREWSGLLLESTRGVTVAFRIAADCGGMTFLLAGASLYGIALPRLLWPAVAARVDSAADGWRVEVSVDAPWFGRLVSYSGRVTAKCT